MQDLVELTKLFQQSDAKKGWSADPGHIVDRPIKCLMDLDEPEADRLVDQLNVLGQEIEELTSPH
jgi:hypothetical protein